jgi:O-antigen/teichoic acid export membrane protein
MIFAFGAITSGITVLSLGGRLLALVCSQQIWVLVSMARNRILCGLVEEGRFNKFQRKAFDRNIFSAVWPSAWRSGAGIFMSQGLIQASGLIYAQHGSSASVASYLLGLRLVQAISQFSQAPFYSKLPMLSKLRATGNISKQIRLAAESMRLSYWVYVACFIFVSALATPLLEMIGSNADFPEPLLWTLLGIGIFTERFGAMHIQLYSTTNHIIWHIANGGSGILYLTAYLFLYSHISVYAFPVGIIIGNLGFYCWYSAWHSYRVFDLKFWEFENTTTLKPLLVMCLFIVSMLVR